MAEVCNNFTQHAWKKDLCSNCLKPRNKHSSPIPAKRPVKSPPGRADPENGGFDADDGSGSTGTIRQKPEARVKPTIAAKPGSPAKPSMIGAKPGVAPKALVKPQTRDGGIIEDGGVYGQGAGLKQPADGAYDDVPHPVPVPAEANQSHYYSEYDVSFKGMSGKAIPVGVGTQARNRSLDRLKNDIEIVMPYNVVDVSTDPPVRDPQSPTGKNGAGKGKCASPLVQEDSPGGSPMARRKDSGSPQFRRNIRILENAMQQAETEGRSSPGQKDDQGRAKKSPFQSPTPGKKPLVADLYEDVEDPDEVPKSNFTRNTPQRSSSGKSSVFEAKLSTIAQNLDLQKKATGKQPPPPPPDPKKAAAAHHSSEQSAPLPTSKKDKKKAKEEAKPEKQRKGSVGKSFFKKLFGRSGGDSDDSDAPPEMTLSVDSDAASLKADDASSTKSSAPGSVEGSPLMSNVRHAVEVDKKEPPGKKVARAESVKEPAPFTAELRQALARGSKIGEKNTTVGRLKEVKREGAPGGVHDAAFAELKGSPLFERRFQQRTYETIDGDGGFEPVKPSEECTKVRPETKKVESGPAVMGQSPQQRIVAQQGVPESSNQPSAVPKQPAPEPQAMQEATHKESRLPPQVAAKPENRPKPEAKSKPSKADPVVKPQDVAAKPEKQDPKLVSYPGDTSTCKRRPAPAAPPPPAPMDAPANRRSTTCTSPVSPRPTGPPPPSPKFPAPEDTQDAPPMLPEKTSFRKRDSLKAEEMEIYGKRAEANMPAAPRTDLPPPAPPPPEESAPVLPEKTKKKGAENGVGGGGPGEVYGKRPQISAPMLQRTSAILDVTVEAGEGASLPDPPPPPVPKTSPQTTSPASTSPQSTLNSDRKQRPRSEISTGKSGTLRRKPDSAPPPPPPEGTRRLSAADVSPPDDALKRLSRGSSEDMISKSQSLPRGGVQHPREPAPGGTLGRTQHQRPKPRQTGRAKTLSEGVTCDADDPNIPVSKHETLTDLSAEITNKFSQRKLPSPPREEASTTTTSSNLPENYYEMVQDDEDSPAAVRAAKRKETAAAALAERARRERSATPYEDVPGENYDDMEFTRKANVVANVPRVAVGGQGRAAGKVNGETGISGKRLIPEPTQNPAMTSSAEYLQPVLHDHSPEDECIGAGGAGVVGQPMAGVPLVMNLSGSGQFDGPGLHHHQQLLHHHQHHPQAPTTTTTISMSDDADWRPKPIPRKKGSPTSSGSSYVMLYSDDSSSDSSRQSGFNPADGWYRLSELQACTLEQIRISLDSMFVGAPASPTTLRWEDFTLESFVPVYCNIGIAFYRATTNRLSIKECLLMLSLCPLPTEVATQPHLGILHPSALYQDLVSATLFPDVSTDPRVYGQCGKVPTTVWVLPFASVCNFEEYCIGLRGLYATKLPIYHRYLCSALQQALSAILYLLNKGCGLQCFQADEILGVTPDGEQEPFVLVLPHHCHVGVKSTPGEPFVMEISQLLMRLLDDRKLASACGMSLNQSRFFRGLYQVAKVLNRNTTPTLFKAQLMCEFMLWGPGEQDLRSILTSHNPQASLDVWLQLERARMIGRYAIEDFVATKEDAHRVHFLVSATDQTLWDTAQLLQET